MPKPTSADLRAGLGSVQGRRRRPAHGSPCSV